MSLVVDASATLARLFPEEKTRAIDSTFAQIVAGGAFVPDLWRIEVGNCLLLSVRRKRITPERMSEWLRSLEAMPIICDEGTNLRAWADTLRLAAAHNLTVHDATYLELALRLSIPLATLDRELRSAAQAEGISLLGL